MSRSDALPLSQAFTALGLAEPLLLALAECGYQAPTPIQAEVIPLLLSGRDVIGQAQTGTGKTAAFALPLLHRLEMSGPRIPRVLVLTPTRELAIQVAEGFTTYGSNLRGLQVAAIYGGQEYGGQLRQLERGVQVVVGTPGRVMDHMRRGSLDLSGLQALVLDEADEMLKMGFIEDVEWILSQAPASRQTTLFSATMPPAIRRVAEKSLQEPKQVTIAASLDTLPDIEQKYLFTYSREQKIVALERVLEAESFTAALIFVRTKVQTMELAEHLLSLGYSAGALNGDIVQSGRQRMIEQFKGGRLDILVATDVAARGLDVERISLVINYDAPFDAETYVHRIGRTGRAGRSGKALLFLSRRERHLLRGLEKATDSKLIEIPLPDAEQINRQRIRRFKEKITQYLAEDCSFFTGLVREYCAEYGQDPELVAAALAKMGQGKAPFLLEVKPPRSEFRREKPAEKNLADHAVEAGNQATPGRVRVRSRGSRPEAGMDRYWIGVGEADGVRPSNIVGAIANEAELDSSYIGRISIFSNHSLVDLPEGMPEEVLEILQKARVNGKMMGMRLEQLGEEPALGRARGKKRSAAVKAHRGNPKGRGAGRGSQQAQPTGKERKTKANQKDNKRLARSQATR